MSLPSPSESQVDAILRQLQAKTLRNYQSAQEDGSDLAAHLVLDSWSARKDEAKRQLYDLIKAEVIGQPTSAADLKPYVGQGATSLAELSNMARDRQLASLHTLFGVEEAA